MVGREGEVEVDFVKVQKRTMGSFMVVIPADTARQLGFKDKERVKVYVDKSRKRVIYEALG